MGKGDILSYEHADISQHNYVWQGKWEVIAFTNVPCTRKKRHGDTCVGGMSVSLRNLETQKFETLPFNSAHVPTGWYESHSVTPAEMWQCRSSFKRIKRARRRLPGWKPSDDIPRRPF